MPEIFDLQTQPQSSNERWPENSLRISGINNSGRDLEAIIARDNVDVRGGLSLAGGTTSYTLAGNRSLANVTLFSGLRVAARVNLTCSANPTLNVSGSGARSISLFTGQAARAGDLVAGMVAEFVFNADANAWILINPAGFPPGIENLTLEGSSPDFRGESTINAAFTAMVQFRGFGRNSAAELTEFARIDLEASDVTNGDEGGRTVMRQLQNGVMTRGFDLRDANRLGLFDEAPASQSNSINMPAGTRFFEAGAPRLDGELIDITRVNNGAHTFNADTLLAVIELNGAGSGGGGSPALFGNAPVQSASANPSTVAGSNISLTASGGRGAHTSAGNGGRDGQAISSPSTSTASGTSVVGFTAELGKGAPGGRGAVHASDGNNGDKVIAICNNLPASVTVSGANGTNGATGAGGLGDGSDGEAGYAIIWEYR